MLRKVITVEHNIYDSSDENAFNMSQHVMDYCQGLWKVLDLLRQYEKANYEIQTKEETEILFREIREIISDTGFEKYYG